MHPSFRLSIATLFALFVLFAFSILPTTARAAPTLAGAESCNVFSRIFSYTLGKNCADRNIERGFNAEGTAKVGAIPSVGPQDLVATSPQGQVQDRTTTNLSPRERGLSPRSGAELNRAPIPAIAPAVQTHVPIRTDLSPEEIRAVALGCVNENKNWLGRVNLEGLTQCYRINGLGSDGSGVSAAPALSDTTQTKTVSDMREEAQMVCNRNPYPGCEEDWLNYGNIYPEQGLTPAAATANRGTCASGWVQDTTGACILESESTQSVSSGPQQAGYTPAQLTRLSQTEPTSQVQTGCDSLYLQGTVSPAQRVDCLSNPGNYGISATPPPASTAGLQFSEEEKQTMLASCLDEDNPSACDTQLRQKLGMPPVGESSYPDIQDVYLGEGPFDFSPSPPTIKVAPTPIVSAVAQSAEEIRDAPSSPCFTGWLSGLNSTFLGRWSGCNTGTPSAPAPQPVAPGAQTVPEAVQPQNASGFRPVITPATAEDFAVGLDTRGQETQGPSVLRRITNALGFTSPEPPAPTQPYRPYVDPNADYTTVDGSTILIKEEGGNVEEGNAGDHEFGYDPQALRLAEEASRAAEQSAQDATLNNTGNVDGRFPGAAEPLESNWWWSDNVINAYPAGEYVPGYSEPDFIPEGSFNYTEPARQLSQAQPPANPFENQSLIAGVFGAFLGQ